MNGKGAAAGAEVADEAVGRGTGVPPHEAIRTLLAWEGIMVC
jgi:hypothetical protein